MELEYQRNQRKMMNNLAEKTWTLRKLVHSFLYGREIVPYGESDDIADLLATVLCNGNSHFHIENQLRSFSLEDYGLELRFGMAFLETTELALSSGTYEVSQFDGNPTSLEEAVTRGKTFVLRTPSDRNLLESVLWSDTHKIEDLRVYFDIGRDASRFLNVFQGLTRLSLLAQTGGFDAGSLNTHVNLKRLSLSGKKELSLIGIENLDSLEHIEVSSFQTISGLSSLLKTEKLNYVYFEDVRQVDNADLFKELHKSQLCDVLGYAGWTK